MKTPTPMNFLNIIFNPATWLLIALLVGIGFETDVFTSTVPLWILILFSICGAGIYKVLYNDQVEVSLERSGELKDKERESAALYAILQLKTGSLEKFIHLFEMYCSTETGKERQKQELISDLLFCKLGTMYTDKTAPKSTTIRIVQDGNLAIIDDICNLEEPPFFVTRFVKKEKTQIEATIRSAVMSLMNANMAGTYSFQQLLNECDLLLATCDITKHLQNTDSCTRITTYKQSIVERAEQLITMQAEEVATAIRTESDHDKTIALFAKLKALQKLSLATKKTQAGIQTLMNSLREAKDFGPKETKQLAVALA